MLDKAVQVGISVAFEGVAYAMILFTMAVGLSVTMGLMRVINLAHGAFAMIGGYLTVTFAATMGLGFLPGVVLAVAAVAGLGILAERGIYTRVYHRRHLDQVLLTVGLLLMATAVVTFVYGPSPYTVALPGFLAENLVVLGRGFSAYRLFIIVVGVAAYLGLLGVLEKTSFGAKLRAAVDNAAMAEAVGINTRRLFQTTFGIGTGLAALGGGLAVDVVGLSPGFVVQYLVPILIIVSLGGSGQVTGSFVAALLIGVTSNAGRYFFPAGGQFILYALTIIVLLIRPGGLYGRA